MNPFSVLSSCPQTSHIKPVPPLQPPVDLKQSKKQHAQDWQTAQDTQDAKDVQDFKDVQDQQDSQDLQENQAYRPRGDQEGVSTELHQMPHLLRGGGAVCGLQVWTLISSKLGVNLSIFVV